MTSDRCGDASIYRQVLGEEFEALAPELKAFHDAHGAARFRGECRIEAAQGAIGRLLGWLAGLPPAAECAEFEFELQASPDRETWVRRFPGRAMRTTLRAVEGQLLERVGPVGCWFLLALEDGTLAMKLARVTVFGLPWPRAWMPLVWGNERGSEGRLYFDAGARFPGVGLVTAYRGYLRIDAAQACAQS